MRRRALLNTILVIVTVVTLVMPVEAQRPLFPQAPTRQHRSVAPRGVADPSHISVNGTGLEIQPMPPYTASAELPLPGGLPTPVHPLTESSGGSQLSPTPLPPSSVFANSGEIHARQAIEDVLNKYLHYWGPRYQMAPVEVTVEGEWAHGVARWQSQDKTLEGPIYVLAHFMPDGTWQALMPSSEGLYLQWVEEVPESLVPAGGKMTLRAQAAEADTLMKQPLQHTPAVPPLTSGVPQRLSRTDEPAKPVAEAYLTTTLVLSPTPTGKYKYHPYVRDGNIWITDENGQSHQRLTSGGHDSNPVLSPDGRFVAYLSVSPQYLGSAPTPQDVCIVNIFTGNSTCLTDEPALRGSPVWNPDSDQLAYVEEQRLVLVSVDRTERRVIATNVATDGPSFATPAWSPRGDALACVLDDEGESAVWLIDVVAGPSRRLLDLEHYVGTPLVFSPDGESITIVNVFNGGQLWTIPLDGSAPAQVGEAAISIYDFSWSSFGDKIAFSKTDGSVWILELDKRMARQVSTQEAPPEVEWVGGDRGILLTIPAVGGTSLVIAYPDRGAESRLTPTTIGERPTPTSSLSPLGDITAPFEWYRYQGEGDSGDCAGDNCGPTSVAMAIQFAHDNQWVAISDIRNQMTGGSCGWTNLDQVRSALSHWGVDHTTITGMDAVRTAVNNHGHIVIVPVWMSYISAGSDYLSPYSDPANRYNRYYSYASGHILVVKGISDDNNWVIVHDPNVWDGNGVYWYSDYTAKGRSRYYNYSSFASAFANNGNQAVEILEVPGGTCDATSIPSGYTKCANEGDRCNFSGTKQVYYGANSCFKVQSFSNGVDCNNDNFGDPVPGTQKACYVEPDSPPSTGNWNARYDQGSTLWWDPNANINPRCTETINGTELHKDWGSNAPCGGMNGDDWVGDFEATINFPAGEYVFHLDHDDGVKLWLNGQNIQDRGGSGSGPVCNGSGGYNLNGDQDLRVLLREESGDAHVHLTWSTDTSVCTPPPSCDPNADQIALYADTGYGGSCVTLNVGDYPNPGYLGDLGNDNAESIRVSGNVQATLCEHDDYQGRCETFTGDDSNLGDNTIGANVVSSVRVQSRDTTPPTGQITSPSDGDVINTCPLTIQAQADDSQSGVSHVEFYANYDGGWHYLGDDYTAPYSWNWDCSSIGDQDVWLTIHIWDNAGNEVVDPGGYVHITLSSPTVGPLVYDGHTIDDDDNNQSNGNDDGIVNCGENIELYVDLYNQGNDTANGVNATISTGDPYVTWPYNTDSGYPAIAGGGTGTNSNDFDFAVDPNTPDGHVIHFDLDINAANGGPWSDSFDVPVTCVGQDKWTFLVYLDGDNNLEGAGIDDFMEMSSVGSSSDVNIVVQLDRIPGYDDSYGNWTDTRRFHITSGMEPWDYNGVSIGEANMGDPQTLIDFVEWGMVNYPADHYAVVVWDHGSGWRLGAADRPLLKDVAFDESSGYDGLDMPELRSAMDTLSNGGADPLDLVGFDACLMGMIEVDDQLIPYADVRVGSEETEPGDGWPYDAILSALRSDPAMLAAQLGTVIVDEYYISYGSDETQSATDLSAYDALNAAVNDLAVALINGLASHYVEIADARNNTQEFYYPTYIDLYDFAYQLDLRVDDAAINASAADVMNTIQAAVIRERHGTGWPGANGISIYFPESEGGYNTTYDGSAGWLQFTADTQWDEWLHAFYDHYTCYDPYEPNDTPDQATSIAYGDTLSDPDICPAGDVDYYAFVGNAGDVIAADIDAQAIGSPLDSYLYLYDTDGVTELAHNDDYDGLDSRIVYTLTADGIYYLMVREYSHPNEGGTDYFYTLSLARVGDFDIDASWTSDAPTIDGQMVAGEWDNAAVYDITAPSTRSLAQPGWFDENLPEALLEGQDQRQTPTTLESPESTVLLYAMNDGDYLYLAIDNPNDATGDTYDQMGIYFDDNPLPSDGLWTNTSCGNPDGEGNFWVLTSTVKYREWISGPVTCDSVIPAPGTNGAVSHESGHAQAEVAIDLDSSALRATPGDVINMYLWIYNADTATFDGYWPIAVDYQDPSTYRPLTLAGTGPLVYYNHAVDDDNNDQSSGDGDGVVECGESIELYVTLRNLGSSTATGINTAISTGDPYVTWLYNTDSDYPDITGGGTGSNNNDFDFAVAPNTPDGHVVQFNLDVNAANGGPWPDSFSLAVSCAQPDLTSSQWSGWEYPVVPSSITGTNVVNTLYAGYPTYIDWGLTNAGDVNTGGNTYGDLYLDDTRIGHHDFGDVLAGQTWAFFDWWITVATPGWHTLKSVADEGDLINESNEANNVFEHDFYWTPVAPYTDDMESGINDWTADGLWHQVDEYTSPYPESYSWSHSWWYGQDITGTYETGAANSGDLTSPPIYIPNSGYYLRFWYWYETETQGPNFDKRVVQISADGGPFYDVLQLYDDPMNWWLQSQTIDLSAYAGHTIRVRFHFDTLDEYFNDYRGWYIDDFEISTTPPPACADDHEPNDIPAQATAITYGQTLSADICPGGDYDFYTFNGMASDKIVIDIDAKAIGSLLDPYIFLLNGDGTSVLAQNDDEILGDLTDSHLGYQLPYTGTYYIKVKAWDHPSAGGPGHFYTITLLTDDNAPDVAVTSPEPYNWLNPNTETITVDASDDESDIREVVFYWHDADWANHNWVLLGDDHNPRDGWTYDLNTSVISEQLQNCAVFVFAYDWAGNNAGYGLYGLGLDRTPPTVTIKVTPMYGDAPFRDFWVDWWGNYDDLSGVADYDVQYQDNAGGAWSNLMIGTTNVYTRFVGLDGHTYSFRARARDYAGNESGYSDESQYTVDICNTPPDSYETDDAAYSAQWITTDGISQTHNIHVEGDQDWMRFYAAAGVTYTLATTNTGGYADTTLSLYDTDATTLLAFNDDYEGLGWASRIDWQPSTDGVYYIKVEHWDKYAYGCTTEYGLTVSANDTTAPTGEVVINDGEEFAASNVVTLTISASDTGSGVDQMMVSNNSDFGDADWVSYTTSMPWTLPNGDETQSVYVRFRDKTGNVSPAYSDSITVDTTSPSGSVIINNDADYTSSNEVTLNLSASDAGSGVEQMLISNNSNFNGATWIDYAATLSWNLPSGEGAHTVYVKFQDGVGNISSAESDSIMVDTTSPSGSVNINNDADYTSSSAVTLNLSASDAGSGVEQMLVSNNSNFNGATWIDYAATLSWNLPSGEGAHTVYVKFQDGVGNISSAESDSIMVDTTSPSGSVNINNDADYTSSSAVTLNLSASDTGSGVEQMLISNNSNFNGATWTDYAATLSWNLPSGEGTHTVYVKFRDGAGNVSSVSSDSIVVDETPPTGNVLINNGDGHTTSSSVTITLSADDTGSGISQMQLSNTSDFNGSSWTSYNTQLAWTLTSGQGTKTVYARFKDTAGNISDICSDSIEVYEPVHASFTANPTTGTAPLTVQFRDTSEGPVATWEWFFGDGKFSSSRHPVHTYQEPGTYSVSLIVKLQGSDAGLPGGTNSTTRENYIIVGNANNFYVYLPLVIRGR